MKIKNLDSQIPYYEIYAGNSRFCFKGHCLAGYDRIQFIGTFLLINLATILILIRIQFDESIIVFVLLTDIMMIRTTLTDPGIIPRINENYQKHIDQYLIPHRHQSNESILLKNSSHLHDIYFCETCKIYKPPHTAHCRRCDNCVMEFDHHCIWLGQCIGRRNYRVFYLFIVFFCILLIDAIIIIGNTIKYAYIEAIIYLIIIFGFLVFVMYLVILHTYLILSNQTTYQYLTTNQFIKDYAYSIYNSEEGSIWQRRYQRFLNRIKLFWYINPPFQRLSDYIYYELPYFMKKYKIESRKYQIKMIVQEDKQNPILENHNILIRQATDNESKFEDEEPHKQQQQLCLSKSQIVNSDNVSIVQKQNLTCSMLNTRKFNNFCFNDTEIQCLKID